MARLKAFVGHSFNEEDESVIRTFLKLFDSFKDIGFEWEHAERAEAKELAVKVKEKMEGKNLFIGIFTRKNLQIPPPLLKPCLLNKQYVKALNNQYLWTTSDWVLQESGYALGKGLNLIFLVEKGVEPVGGLQGNLEYIPFERENISQSFTKLNEIITSLVRTEASEVHKAAKDSPVDESTKTTEPVGEPTSFAKLMIAIKTENAVGEEAALQEMLNEEPDGDKKVDTICFYHWLRYRYGKKDILSDLQKLAEEYPKHPTPSMWLGVLYEDFKQYDKSANQFMVAAELAINEVDKTNYICRAAKILIDDNDYKKSKNLIMERLLSVKDTSKEELFELYHVIALIQKKTNQDECYLSLTEKLLEIKPTESDIRFDLAHKYSENKNHIMALYHYKILCDSSPSSASWNNLGVELSELGLLGKSVEAYIKAKEMGGTKAAGSLAYRLIDGGFFKEAKHYIQDALKQDNCSSYISDAMSSLEEKIDSETKKESELLSHISPKIKFRVKYAEGYTKKSDLSALPKKWKTKHGEVGIILDGNRFEASGSYTRLKKMGLADYMKAATGAPSNESETISVRYEGIVVNSVVDYQLSVTIKPLGGERRVPQAVGLPGVIPEGGQTITYNGQMILNDDLTQFEVMESDTKGVVEFYDITVIKGEN